MNEVEHRKVFISAGELSGDEHAAQVVTALRASLPTAIFRGMGGRNLREVGVDTVVDSETSASVMGFTELFGSLGKILNALGTLKALLKSWQPDLVVLVDYQDFHFRLARHAHALGIPVLFFVSPSVWAWRPGRIKNVKQYVDTLACIFPFEPSYYSERGYQNAVYVGHPFQDDLRHKTLSEDERLKLRAELGIAPEVPLLALFPGSRKKEISGLLAPMLDGLALARKQHPTIEAIVPLVESVATDEIRARLEREPNVHTVDGRSIEVLQIANAGLLKSGTSNLQAALCGLPFTMLYRANKLTEAIVKTFVKLNQYSIVNVIEEHTVRELIQEGVNAAIIGEEISRLLFDTDYRSALRDRIAHVASQFTVPTEISGDSAPARVAHLANHLFNR